MKIEKKVLVLIFSLLIFFGAVSINAQIEYKDYVNSPPITIYSNADFANYGILGSGTESDPYVIENYNITGSGAYGIMIGDGVSAYFVIRNCLINGFDAGIIVSGASTPLVIIEDNIIYASNNGIGVASTYQMAYIFRNTIIGATEGIAVVDSTEVAIVNNTITGGNFGINLATIERGLILNNTINVEQWGISIDIEVQNTVICWNTITGFSEVAIGINGESSDKEIYYHHNTAIAGEPSGLYATYGLQYYPNPNIYWYDPETNEGNYWSDWSSTNPYPIKDPNGNTVAEDPYPFTSPPVPTGSFPGIPNPPVQTTTSGTNTGTTNTSSEETSETEDALTNPLTINISIPLLTIALLAISSIIVRKRL